ncbi:MAG: hypothetical protein ACE5IR_02380 [bacterium]
MKSILRTTLARSSILLFFIAVFELFAVENSISIDSNVDKSTIRIGDLIKYSIMVTRTPDIQVAMPGLAANLGAFEIRDYEVFAPELKDSVTVDRVEYIISTFDVGEFEIPSLTFLYTLEGDTTTHALKTRVIKIVVESLKPSEAGDIRDIKAPLGLPRNYRKIILWGSILFAFLVLLSILFYIWRRRKAGKGLLPQKVEPPQPAHEIAFEELQTLQNSSLLADGKFKEFYVRVSEIIRQYIEGRYFIIALELTTFELIENLRASGIEPEYEHRIHEFLKICDLVKFAKYHPTDQESVEILDRAFDIVEQTKLLYDYTEEASGKPEEETPEEETIEKK